MCDVVSRVADNPALPAANRRAFLRALGLTSLVVGGVTMGACSGPPNAPAPASATGGTAEPPTRTRVILLGTSGGPQMLSAERTGISTAIVYEDRCYLVDLGWGCSLRMLQAGLGDLRDGPGLLNAVSGIFFTHLHSDHVTEWPATYATGTANSVGRTLPPIQVFGPGDRLVMPRVFPAGRTEPPLVNPERPGIGTSGMTEHLRLAFALDLNDRIRDTGLADPLSLFQVRDIDLGGVWDVGADGVPPRLRAPIPVWDDGAVRVTATLVDHRPTAPSFAYRFDTPDGSVVVSGDTTVSENLIDLARDVDVLVHEVIDPVAVDRIVATLPPAIASPVRQHLLASHTTLEQVGRDVAQPARAKNLVLTHMITRAEAMDWQVARAGYSGNLVVGADLLQIPVGA